MNINNIYNYLSEIYFHFEAYLELIRTYVHMVNSNDFPCIESTFDLISFKMCKKAKDEAIDLYNKVSNTKTFICIIRFIICVAHVTNTLYSWS